MLLFHEKISREKCAGILIGLAGLVSVVWSRSILQGSQMASLGRADFFYLRGWKGRLYDQQKDCRTVGTEAPLHVLRHGRRCDDGTRSGGHCLVFSGLEGRAGFGWVSAGLLRASLSSDVPFH